MSIEVPETHIEGTLYGGVPCAGKHSYISPEVFRRAPVDPFAADIWGLGIIMYVMVTGMPLYGKGGDQAFRACKRGQFDQLVNHYRCMGCKTPEGPIKAMIRSMLSPNPSDRPTAEMLWDSLYSDRSIAPDLSL